MAEIRGWPHHIVKIQELLRAYRPGRCVEIGTFCGASAIPIAQTIAEWHGRLTCIDPWAAEPGNLRECADNLIKYDVASRVSLIVAPSLAAAEAWDTMIDFLYIDGDHRYEAVLADLRAWWPWLADGAVICGDDYDDPLSPGVRRAWEAFGEEVGQVWFLHATPNTNPPGMKLVWGRR